MHLISSIATLVVFGVVVYAPGLVTAQERSVSEKSLFKGLLSETDKNKDGKISRQEYLARSKDNKTAEENFNQYDLNGDGFITEDEYTKVAGQLTRPGR